MSWNHLKEVVPSTATAIGVRVVENVPVGLMFVGCVKTQRCIDEFGILSPLGYGMPQRDFKCNECGEVYEVLHPVSDTLSKQNYFDLDGQYWLSVWIGVDRSLVGIRKFEM